MPSLQRNFIELSQMGQRVLTVPSNDAILLVISKVYRVCIDVITRLAVRGFRR